MSAPILPEPPLLVSTQKYSAPRTLAFCDTSPQGLETWLNASTTETPQQSLALSVKALRGLMALSCPVELRFAMLEVLRKRLRHQYKTLLEEKAFLFRPSEPGDLALHRLLDYLNSLLNRQYQLTLEECLEQHRVRRLRRLSCSISQRLLWGLLHRLEHFTLTRTQTSPGIWTELHHLYRLGEKHRWLNRSVADPLLGNHLWIKPYQQAILLGSSSYAQLNNDQLSAISRLTARLASFVHISSKVNQNSSSPGQTWVLSLNLDRPPQHPGSQSLRGNNTRWVDFQSVVAELKRIHPSHTGLERHLQHTWDRPLTRRRRRQPRSIPVKLAVGLQGAFQLNSTTTTATRHSPLRELVMVDSSASGMQVSGNLPGTISVGELVCYQEQGMTAWGLASVCWIRHHHFRSECSMGLQCLSPGCTPVLARLCSVTHQHHETYPALLAPIPSLSPEPLLILPRKIFQPQDRILLNLEGEIEETEVGQPLLSTSRFWIAQKQDAFANVI